VSLWAFLLFCGRSRRARGLPWLFHSYAGHTAAAASSFPLSTIICGATGQPSQLIAQLHGPPRPVLDRLPITFHVSRFTSHSYMARRGRYWIASARCAVSIRSLPARSAIVRASFRMR